MCIFTNIDIVSSANFPPTIFDTIKFFNLKGEDERLILEVEKEFGLELPKNL